MFSCILFLAVTLPTIFSSVTGATVISDFASQNASDHATSILSERAALGNAIVSNRCNYDVWLWSVDEKNSPKQSTKIPARSKHTEKFRTPCPGCGVSMKISKTNGLEAGKITQLEYAIRSDQIYYDISFVDCAKGKSAANCPGHDKGIRIDSPESTCRPLNCAGGTYCVKDAYFVDQPKIKLGVPEPVLGCGKGKVGMDVYFKLCSDAAPLRRDILSVAGRIAVEKASDA
ncbi:hypothetical protein K469DRAFT_704331 [Zopfia rhizophila CBS 207.26]|uniref:Uncharacterized protein n=1 Tax=Zopfia rhizophila CBS 207.26 TaxID=1314779 RepID=A0A6A6E7X3_9PEZI|nr:hypothetical protein K469DRAFT_704331 [Zopfia rhizophila CBS 207.26]